MNCFAVVLECVREGENLEFSLEIFTLKPTSLQTSWHP